MLGRVVGVTIEDGLVVETELDPVRQPFLHDHRIDDAAVLPGVMGIEAFAEVATVLWPRDRVDRRSVDVRLPRPVQVLS